MVERVEVGRVVKEYFIVNANYVPGEREGQTEGPFSIEP